MNCYIKIVTLACLSICTQSIYGRVPYNNRGEHAAWATDCVKESVITTEENTQGKSTGAKLDILNAGKDLSTNDLSNLIAEAEKNLLSKRTTKGMSNNGSPESYKQEAGLVNKAEANASNWHGNYKPEWLFDNSLGDKNNYETEWRPDRVPNEAKNKNHWIQFKLEQEYIDIILKFSYLPKESDYRGPTKVAFVAPRSNESLDKFTDWTDTLYIGNTYPQYPTTYDNGFVKPNTTFTGNIKFSHAAKDVRMAVLEVDPKDPSVKPQTWGGPTWKLCELRIYDSKDWEESPIYKKIPEEVKKKYISAIENAKAVKGNDPTVIRKAYDSLLEAHKEFDKAYLYASSTIVKMSTQQSVGDTLSFFVNHSDNGYTVDWGDGNLISYTTSPNECFNKLHGTLKGKEITIFCQKGWTLLHANSCKLTSIDLSMASSLQSLYLSNNQLKQISLKGLKSLQDLDCSYNTLETVEVTNPKNISEDIPDIRQLRLDHNKLQGEWNFNGLSKMLYLNVANNEISNLTLGNAHLKTLICSHNILSNSLSLKNAASIANLICNDNRITFINWADSSSKAYKYVADNNKMNMLINVSAAAHLKHLSCANNNLKMVRLPENHQLEALNLAHNRLTFSALPGEKYKPTFLNFGTQDTIDISYANGMIQQDTISFAPIASTWADRQKSAIDLTNYCSLGDKTTDADAQWFSIDKDGNVKEMKPCLSDTNGDFWFENGKTSFFKAHSQAYVELTSRVYGVKLVSYPINIGNVATSIQTLTTGSHLLNIKSTERGLLLQSDSRMPVIVAGLDGKIVWKGFVDGTKQIELTKGIYLVNDKKIMF